MSFCALDMKIVSKIKRGVRNREAGSGSFFILICLLALFILGMLIGVYIFKNPGQGMPSLVSISYYLQETFLQDFNSPIEIGVISATAVLIISLLIVSLFVAIEDRCVLRLIKRKHRYLLKLLLHYKPIVMDIKEVILSRRAYNTANQVNAMYEALSIIESLTTKLSNVKLFLETGKKERVMIYDALTQITSPLLYSIMKSEGSDEKLEKEIMTPIKNVAQRLDQLLEEMTSESSNDRPRT